MKHLTTLLILAAALAVTSSAWAMMSGADAAALVQRMESNGESATRILRALTDDGRSLDAAAALAIQSSPSEDAQVALARAALCAPGATPATGEVVVEAAEQSRAVQFAVDTFDPRTCAEGPEPPPSYLDLNTPGRGGVSTAS